jgi:ATP-dependent RNA helicase RhlE
MPVKVTSLHSDRTQGQRQMALSGFQRGHYQIMVATDIAARGLDVEGISHVINFDMPDTADAYIHRIGRTGRAGRTGDAFTLVTREDEPMIRTLEKMTAQNSTGRHWRALITQPGPVRPHSV